ncbi:DNA-binding protein WhiA [Boudabousia marimammalium]|uniref:Probable cell division protein WhiA n=1 Tax=Boudabousia marimammalium TaxID=156892 RepID=A0A1Q5PR28_9ACTO|nr:DNA-binding protein WhiA [Boudabousia marimammalium]OKL50024.1 DNA-binding protein WhiA [Boudabousia marimammalium]
MSLTTDLKDEIARTPLTVVEQRRAYVASLIRFAGGLHLVARRVVIEAELDNRQGAEYLQAELKSLYQVDSELVVVTSSGIRRGDRYVVRVVHGADRLARLTGLIDVHGRPVRGLPPVLVAGNRDIATACWRGAFMARGSLMEPGRSSAMEITCPGPETALALVGTARRMGAVAKSREVRGVDRVMVRDGEQISMMLSLMNCLETREVWEERRKARELRGSVNRLANFDDANLRRSVRAAVTAGARVERAFEILGEDVPEHLVEAGKLRIQFKEASLEELGQKSTPPLTKDAVAGRIRRLLAMADKKAHDLQIPDTNSVVTAEMLDD